MRTVHLTLARDNTQTLPCTHDLLQLGRGEEKKKKKKTTLRIQAKALRVQFKYVSEGG